MNIDAVPRPMPNCQYYAEISCQGSGNINEYTTCWVPVMEQCSNEMTIRSNRIGDGNNCYIEEELTTEVVCFLGTCVNVSYTQYNLVC